MAIELHVDPLRSFRFVSMVKTVTARSTTNRPARLPRGLDAVSPMSLRNSARKSAIRVQSRITHQDRLIDIIV